MASSLPKAAGRRGRRGVGGGGPARSVSVGGVNTVHSA